MNHTITLREMQPTDWEQVAVIYEQALITGESTFQTEIPEYKEWDSGHLKECRIVAEQNNRIIGWVALTPFSNRLVYKGVAQVSIYIHEDYRGKGIGSLLISELINKSEEFGFWTLQSAIFESNMASVKLHEKHGFRIVGYREKIGKTLTGEWINTLLLERRSQIIY
ncbi:phosphinothricin N-acetyltransferase [Anaerocolumna cellulosilytica]|uniref:Phosphinothricin N-acetyltransferase n=1 Tax=Anaerocolumna cellulosilytica TaxID=433286 RepID=A0A6S6QVU2_9FIRM|nr:GNAT family N-acetyltransferase [Anaerocolumna cellulosilytica]MBB5194071.1 phosphinothricin acetyltransferase [Anaerocolumna cellulosilytica]BCJ94714.1 phosphinothricin N-acetyltransferase [Anaerocolumna cellulosilytica]